ncbi:MAG: lysylphosphatidylglycerol synthase transmembrane domain-containing protein [Chloroflexota bacterium]
MLPGLVISLICLAAIFYLVDPHKLLAALQQANFRLVLLSYLISLLWLLIRGIIWRTLLQEKATLRQTFLTFNEGNLLNNLLPFRLGEVGRAFLLARKANLGFWQVFSTVLIERALDVALAAGLLLSTLPFVVGADWAQTAAVAAGGIVLTGLGVLYFLAHRSDWAMQQFERLAGRFSFTSRLQQSIGTQLRLFLSGLEVLTDLRRFLAAVSWSVLNWCIAIGQYYILMRAFFPESQFLWAAFSLGVIALGISVPSSPGNLGPYELALVTALSLFGLDQSASAAMAFTAHFGNYLVTGLIGAYALAQDGETLANIYRQIQHIPDQTAQ